MFNARQQKRLEKRYPYAGTMKKKILKLIITTHPYQNNQI